MLLNACMSAAPGQKECDNALRNIQVRFAMDDPLALCWYCTLKQNLVFECDLITFPFIMFLRFHCCFFFVTVTDVIQTPRNQALWGLACVLRICVWKNHKMKLFQQYYCILPFVVQYFSTPHFGVWASLYFSTLGTEMVNPFFLCRLWVAF